jgi:hypothetical protein
MKRAVRTLITTVGCAAVATALPATSRAAAPAVRPPAPLTDPSIAWNQFLLGVQATPGDQPATVHPTYELAITHAAIYDAVVAIERDGAPYLASVRGPHGASAAAAADAAAHDTLVALYPSLRPSIEQQYTTLLGQLPSGRGQAEGILVGRRVAAELLQRRANDGATAAPIAFQPGTEPADYQLTPPAFGQPVFTHWSHVKPFVLRRADEFRPPAPPALTSAKYAAAVNEVQAVGAATGSTRTADQTQIGLFWNPPIWATWNRIAETAAVARHDTLFGTARTFAALNLTYADSVIALYDAKYTYRFWRPVTAIHAADTDGNPATIADPDWSPLSPTAPDPSYPGAHGTISAAGAAMLASFYGNDTAFTVTSTALPGVARTFTSFSEAADEATVSRIYNGNHTRIDQMAGENLGQDVAGFVLARTLRR